MYDYILSDNANDLSAEKPGVLEIPQVRLEVRIETHLRWISYPIN